MSIIQFKEANCKNCYKCIRSCPVKAIAFQNEQARIVEEDCMLCGNCLKACPQNAKTVKSFINQKEKVYVSLAPSFISAFDDGTYLFSALKKLGFTDAFETAIGAMAVSRQYERLMGERKMKNIITTACPSINFLIEKYYPELIGQMAPVVSPMIAHAKILKSTYGQGIRVVFIGPCLSKKDECNDLQNEGAIDAVLTFEELDGWLEAEGLIKEGSFTQEVRVSGNITARSYPIPGGILQTIDDKYKANYKCIGIDGVDRCIKVLDSIRDDGIENYFIEMNSCQGGCISGPCMNEVKGGFLTARERLVEYVKRASEEENSIQARADDDPIQAYADGNPIQAHTDGKPFLDFDADKELYKKFLNRRKKYEIPSEAVLQGILNSIGKFTKDKELNCGACGYPTCRDKAIAVYNNKAQLHMCLPYMRERAESISNLIINTTPNAIFALDSELKIQEINMAAREKFGLSMEDIVGENIYDLLECEDFIDVLESHTSIYDKKYYYEKLQMTVEQSVIFIPEQNVIIAIIKDITEEERLRLRTQRKQAENVELAQKVIDKQMRVAQEIASLLGETTAETKVALTKLKKSIMAGMDDIK